MATLTEQLSTPTSGARVIDPGPLGPSGLGAIAETASSVFQGFRGAPSRRELAEARFESTQGGLEDELASTFFGLRQAEEQGLDSNAFRLRFDQAVADVVGRNPSHSAEIMEWLRVEGFTDVLPSFTAMEDDRALEIARRDADEAAFQYAVQNNPLIAENIDVLDREEVIQSGRRLQATQNLWEQETARAQEAARAASEHRAQTDWELGQRQRSIRGLALETASTRAAPLVNNLLNQFVQAGDNVDQINSLTAQVPATIAQLNQIRITVNNQLQGVNAEQDTIDNFNEEIDRYIGTLSVFGEAGTVPGAQAQIINTLSSSMRLDLYQAIPAMARMEAVFDTPEIAALVPNFAEASALQSGLVADAAAYVAGESGVRAENGSRVIQELTGVGVSTASPEMTQAFGSYFRSRLDNYGETLETEQPMIPEFINDYAEYLEVSRDLVPGQISTNDLVGSVDTLFSEDRIRQLNELEGPHADAVQRAAALEAARLLQDSELISGPEDINLGARDFGIEFDNESGYFTLTIERTPGSVIRSHRGVGSVISALTAGRAPRALNDRIEALNQLLDFLNAFGGAEGTPLEARRMWARGETPSVTEDPDQSDDGEGTP